MTDSEITLPETLNAESEPHHCYGGWHNFIREHTELVDEHDGVKFFNVSNCNYIVFPSGLLVQNYGYHGRALMGQIRERGAPVMEIELLDARRRLKEVVRGVFWRERQAARHLCVWLRDCSQVERAVPVEVSFGTETGKTSSTKTWFGALYREVFKTVASERLVTEGPMAAGDNRYAYRFYLIGRRYYRPRRSDKWVATYDLPEEHKQPLEPGYGESNEWYVSHYWEDGCSVTPSQRIYAPFGPMFGLSLHRPMNFGDYKDYKIDTGEPKPYVRLPMTVKYIPAEEEPC